MKEPLLFIFSNFPDELILFWKNPNRSNAGTASVSPNRSINPISDDIEDVTFVDETKAQFFVTFSNGNTEIRAYRLLFTKSFEPICISHDLNALIRNVTLMFDYCK